MHTLHHAHSPYTSLTTGTASPSHCRPPPQHRHHLLTTFIDHHSPTVHQQAFTLSNWTYIYILLYSGNHHCPVHSSYISFQTFFFSSVCFIALLESLFRYVSFGREAISSSSVTTTHQPSFDFDIRINLKPSDTLLHNDAQSKIKRRTFLLKNNLK